MTIGMEVHGITTELGPGSLLHGLLSTASHHLEPGGWGTRFPVIMNKFYQGRLAADDADEALQELASIRAGLEHVPPFGVIWDIENPSEPPPWGKDVAAHVRNMASYFVTSGGENFLDVIVETVEFLKQEGGELRVVSFEQ
jgi:hypothetical protein